MEMTMREYTPAVEFEHQLREYAREAVQHFDKFVEGINQSSLGIDIKYDHNSGDGNWKLYTYCNGAGTVETQGAVLRNTILAHCASVADRYANRRLPSLLPAPVNHNTTISNGEAEQD
jgi:hypothetical protein